MCFMSAEIFIPVSLAGVYLSCEAAVPGLNDRNKMSAFTSPLMFTERRIGHSRAELLSSLELTTHLRENRSFTVTEAY